MKVLIYIGHHKVGSTALQVFLSQNACALMRAGILYPCVEMQGFSQLLARAVGTGDHNRWMMANLREPHSALAYRMIGTETQRPVPPQFKSLPSASQMLHAIRSQIIYLKPKTVVLCSEAFANFGDVNPDLIPQLRAAFPKAEVEIYCALRRPDEYITSWHGQRIKVGEPVAALPEAGLGDYEGTIHIDYRKVVSAWAEALPEARLHLRNYADIQTAGGSPEDFFAQTGVTLPNGLFPPVRSNPSLPLAATEIKRLANLTLPHAETEKLAQYLLRQTTDIKAVPNADIEMLSPAVRAKLQAQFAPAHAYLNRMTGRDAFFPDIDQVLQTRPVPQHDATLDYLAQLDPDNMPTQALRTFIADLQSSAAG